MVFPLVSVIIPAFNAERHIQNALDTVFHQSYRPIEIIIVDDGSYDTTSQKIKGYPTSPGIRHEVNGFEIRYFRQENGGPSMARNRGIKESKGKYIAFLDVDDFWTSEKIRKQIELMEQSPFLDIVLTDVQVSRGQNSFDFFSSENLGTDFFGPSPPFVQDPVIKLLKNNFIHTSSILAKKICFEDGLLFNENRRYAEDWELWLRWAVKGFSFGCLPELCVIKQEDGRGLTSHQQKMHASIAEVLQSFWTKRVKKKLSRSQILAGNRIVSQRYRWLGHYFYYIDRFTQARGLYWKSFRSGYNPVCFIGWLRALLIGSLQKE